MTRSDMWKILRLLVLWEGANSLFSRHICQLLEKTEREEAEEEREDEEEKNALLFFSIRYLNDERIEQQHQVHI